MTEQPIQPAEDLFRCDIRGCCGVGEYTYVDTIAERPAVVVVCAVHRLERFAFAYHTARLPTTIGGDTTDVAGHNISRVDWLRLEIGAAEGYLARFAASSDPIEQTQVRRRKRELVALRAVLAFLDPPPADESA